MIDEIKSVLLKKLRNGDITPREGGEHLPTNTKKRKHIN